MIRERNGKIVFAAVADSTGLNIDSPSDAFIKCTDGFDGVFTLICEMGMNELDMGRNNATMTVCIINTMLEILGRFKRVLQSLVNPIMVMLIFRRYHDVDVALAWSLNIWIS